jgi:hypothetical protein
MSAVRYISMLMIAGLIAACRTVVQSSGPLTERSPSETPVQAPLLSSTDTHTVTPRPTPKAPLAPNAWMSLPIVPTISDTARVIYARGLEMGNNPRTFSKVGDCQSSTDFFLVDFDHPGDYRLGDEYASLQSTIDFYQGSFARQSKAVQDGFNVAAVLSPLRADPNSCDKGESPLACELRLNRPSVVIVSMETNFSQQSAAKYGKYMRQIVENIVSRGAVPVLATKADNLEGDNSINAMIAEIAYEYDVPLWNFWAAAHPLPNHGFDTTLKDGFHLSFARNFFDDPIRMESAWPWRNLTALETLDALRHGLIEN